MSLLDTTQLALEAALRGSSLRQTLLTNNVANADTPGYQRVDVDFQATLRGALAQEGGESAEGESALAQLQFQPETQPLTGGPAGTGVNVEQEETQIAENALDYETLTGVLGARDAIMRSAMGLS